MFRILGVLEVDGAGPLGGTKSRAVLARLLLESGGSVDPDRLIEDLWGEEPPATARHAIQVYVSTLRRTLGEGTIRSKRGGYHLEVRPEDIDAVRFERLAREGRRFLERGEPAEAHRALGEALGLWRGPALADLAPAFEAERARLAELRLAATEDLIDADLALGRHDELVAELERLAADHPFRERFRRQLMLALYRGGRQGEALDAYRDARRTLVEELGLEPSSELRELEAAILRQEASLTVEAPELRTRRHLPASATPLVGRRREVREVGALLRDEARLLTLTGPGGIGKTRLALRSAHELADRFADGVFFVALAALRDYRLVVTEIARTLEVDTPRDPYEALAGHLRDRATLLVLDNFEHVDEAASFLGPLLGAAPDLRLLVTSRHRLNLYGEHFYPVAPLAVDEEAVPLFVQRAGAAGRRLHPSTDIREICLRLDCLPLAVELAAARSNEFSPADMLASMQSRLELATGGPRDVPARQRTLEATIEWSYDLLDHGARSLFERLAVFAGGWDAETAGQIVDAERGDLYELVRRSLVVQAQDRYSMLETIHEFATKRLEASGEARRVQDRHIAFFLALAEEGDRALARGENEAGWLARFDREHDNLRAALGRTAKWDGEAELRLAAALGRFWEFRGHVPEGLDRLVGALGRARGADDRLRMRGLLRAGVFFQMRGDLKEATRRMEEALGIAQHVGDRAMEANALRNLGTIAKEQGDHDGALALHHKARGISEEVGDRQGISSSLINMTDVTLATGEYATAERLARESLALARQLGNGLGEVISLLNLGLATLELGREAEAAAIYDQALEMCGRLGYGEASAFCFLGLAALSERRGELARAAMLLAMVERRLHVAGAVLESTERPLRDRTIELVRERLDDATFQEMWNRGAEMSLDEAIAEGRRVANDLRHGSEAD